MGPLLDNSAEIVIDEVATAKLLNDYFASVYTEENTKNVPKPINYSMEKKKKHNGHYVHKGILSLNPIEN